MSTNDETLSVWLKGKYPLNDACMAAEPRLLDAPLGRNICGQGLHEYCLNPPLAGDLAKAANRDRIQPLTTKVGQRDTSCYFSFIGLKANKPRRLSPLQFVCNKPRNVPYPPGHENSVRGICTKRFHALELLLSQLSR